MIAAVNSQYGTPPSTVDPPMSASTAKNARMTLPSRTEREPLRRRRRRSLRLELARHHLEILVDVRKVDRQRLGLVAELGVGQGEDLVHRLFGELPRERGVDDPPLLHLQE